MGVTITVPGRHTMANLIKSELHLDPRVSFSAYSVADDVSRLQVVAQGEELDALSSAIQSLKERFESLRASVAFRTPSHCPMESTSRIFEFINSANGPGESPPSSNTRVFSRSCSY